MKEPVLSAVFVGQESLLIQCAQTWQERGHSIRAIVTPSREIRRWATQQEIRLFDSPAALLEASPQAFDFLFSVTHLSILPDAALELPERMAVNFHDGPLPGYAGLNVTTWALLNNEPRHAVTWHVIEPSVDSGAVLESAAFDIASNETAFSLNTKCYEAGISTFASLVADFESGSVQATPQDGTRRLFKRTHRPPGGGLLLPSLAAEQQVRMIRALDFGGYDNPVAVARLPLADQTVVVTQADVIPWESGAPRSPTGTIVDTGAGALTVSTSAGNIRYSKAVDPTGRPVDLGQLAHDRGWRNGEPLPVPTESQISEFERLDLAAARGTLGAVRILRDPRPLPVPFASSDAPRDFEWKSSLQKVDESDPTALASRLAVFLGKLADARTFDLVIDSNRSDEWSDDWSHAFRFDYPVRLDFSDRSLSVADACYETAKAIRNASEHAVLHRDLEARYTELNGLDARRADLVVDLGTGAAASNPASVLRLRVGAGAVTWEYNAAVLDERSVGRMQAAFTRFLDVASNEPTTTLAAVSLLDDAERNLLLQTWNATERDYDRSLTVHGAFRAQASRTPGRPAVSWAGGSMTYEELDARSNQLANVLRERGTRQGHRIGVCTDRSADMLVAVLGILKCGAAYVPLDPDFPSDRVRYMIDDANLQHVVCQSATLPLASGGEGDHARILVIDDEVNGLGAAATSPPEVEVRPDDTAYVIYTSGSTGRPKGVTVQHRNVANFFAGMDDLIPHGTNDRWLAVTSLSFDISVLELLWTLSTGFEVVLADPTRAVPPAGHGGTQRPLDFSLFFFSSGGEGEPGPDAYRLLFESTQFADRHGFAAVWTPERHFHAFGGLFPNPSVVSAALAARTSTLQLRAGSCVSPLHHPIRVAEEWSVVDNISGGRTGIAFAAGWQPNDFVLMPQNFADRKTIMFEQIETIRALWRGESVSFPGHSGAPVQVRTLPRPVQADLPVWITTAGNPETFRMAGEAGYNVLTHLLGQSVEEIEEKIRHYREGRASRGHEGPGSVALMLHTFVHPDPDFVRETVREPMKTYLRSAVSLVKDAAWSFPTFKDKTMDDGGRFTMENLTPDEEDALLEHAFERYYKTSGLFGTPEHCRVLVEKLAQIGVDDVACLIDFGIDTDETLGALEYLEVLRASHVRTGTPTKSIAEIIEERSITHMQCTPSMARMIVSDEAGRKAISRLSHLCVGGEALPAALAVSLGNSVTGTLQNMYGPTETTIWSSVADLTGEPGAVTIGRPIANTQLYLLDSDGQPVSTGLPGNLYIGGDGVTAGYLDRPELTAERFVPNPFDGGVMYDTGDRCKYRDDGTVEFLGRADNQTKIRGYRIELGEIEHELANLDGVQAAVATVRTDMGDEPTIVAYVIGGTADPSEALAKLRKRLPEHMIPSRIMSVSDFPMTPNGKVDRAMLPAPSTKEHRSASTVAPREGLEQLIANVWATVLDVDSVGADENFFDIGGHSLLAVQVNSRLAEELGRELSLIDFFRYPTVSTLASHLSANGGQQDVAAVRTGASRADARRAARRRR